MDYDNDTEDADADDNNGGVGGDEVDDDDGDDNHDDDNNDDDGSFMGEMANGSICPIALMLDFNFFNI